MIAINRYITFIMILNIFTSFNAVADSDQAYKAKCVPDSVIFNDILGCFIDEYKDADQKLNLIYKSKMTHLSKYKQLKLKKIQRDWIKKKETSCVADEMQYGRESHFEAMQCRIDMTNQRIQFLKIYK